MVFGNKGGGTTSVTESYALIQSSTFTGYGGILTRDLHDLVHGADGA